MISNSTVNRALDLIQSPASAAYFFEQIKSPDWIAPLASRKLFAVPYPAQRSGDGISFPIWTPGEYLGRMAEFPDVQKLIVDILKDLPASDNPRVYEAIAETANVLPPQLARHLVPQLTKGLQLPFQLLLPNKVADTILNLASKDYDKSALVLAKELFTIVSIEREAKEKDGTQLLTRDARSRFDSWEYAELLERTLRPLVLSSGTDTLDLMSTLLEDAIEAARLHEIEDGKDYSTIWRPRVDQSGGQHGDIRDNLVSAVRDASLFLVEQAPEDLHTVVSQLRTRQFAIFNRVALFVAAKYRQATTDIDEVWSGPLPDWKDYSLQPELDEFMRVFFGRYPEEVQEDYFAWVDNGPNLDDYTDFCRQYGHDPQEAEMTQHVEVWIRDRLTPVAPYLSGARAVRLDTLITLHGAPLEKVPNRSTASPIVYQSPLTDQEIQELSWTTLIAYAQSWTPGKGFDEPSAEGLANSFQQRASKNPHEVIRHLPDIVGLLPVYLSAILDALKDTIDRKEALDWASILIFSQRILMEGQAHIELEDWRWVRRATASLVRNGFDVGEASIPPSLRQESWRLLKLLAEDPHPSPEEEAALLRSGWDTATLSLNVVKGVAFHGVIRYALWWHRHLEIASEAREKIESGLDSMPEVRALIESHLRIDPSLAVRAALGQWFAWLVLIDSEWASDKMREIFPNPNENRSFFEAAWYPYIVHTAAYTNVLPILRPAYRDAIGLLLDGKEKIGRSDRRSECLGDHLMVYYWRGEIALSDDLLRDFFDKAPDSIRSHALGWIGRNLHRLESGDLAPEIASRLQDLWNWRSDNPNVSTDELRQFGLWFGSGRMDYEWSMEVLDGIFEKGILPEFDQKVLELLTSKVEEHTKAAVKSLDHMVQLAPEVWYLHTWRTDAETILKAGIESTDPEVQGTSERIINIFVESRIPNFRELLKRT